MRWKPLWEANRLALGLAVLCMVGAIWFITGKAAGPEAAFSGETVPGTLPSASTMILPADSGEWQDSFADLRLERERSRSRREELFQSILSDNGTKSDLRSAAQQELWRITRLVALEDELEGLLRVQGLKQVIVMLQDQNATIIVKGQKLASEQVREIAGMVARLAGVSPEKIHIYERD